MLAKLTRLFPLWAVLLSVAAYDSPGTFLGIGPCFTHHPAHRPAALAPYRPRCTAAN